MTALLCPHGARSCVARETATGNSALVCDAVQVEWRESILAASKDEAFEVTPMEVLPEPRTVTAFGGEEPSWIAARLTSNCVLQIAPDWRRKRL
jgi:hypothetical protein